jgi:hypothetical protein
MLKTVSSITNAIGALNYKGTWDASTNNPTLTSSVGTKGDYYVVSVAGSTNLNGETLWGVGDWAVFNGSIWQKVDGGDTGNFATLTVTGLTGYMYANGSNAVTASTTIPVANVTGAVPNTVNVLAGTGMTGGGALTGNVTLTLANTAVSAGTYGTASQVSQVTIDAQGRITSASNVSIAIANSAVSGLGTMSTQNASAVAITGGTINSVSHSGGTFANISVTSGNVVANVTITNSTSATATYATASLPLVPAGFIQIQLANATVVKVPYYAS